SAEKAGVRRVRFQNAVCWFLVTYRVWRAIFFSGGSPGAPVFILRMTLNGFVVKRNNEAIEVQATSENFPPRRHNLTRAILAVNEALRNYDIRPVPWTQRIDVRTSFR